MFEGSTVFVFMALTADHFEHDVHVAARGKRVGADLFVRFPDERGKLGMRDAPVLDAHLHREAETAAFARAHRHGAGDRGLGGVALLLLGDEIKRPAASATLSPPMTSPRATGIA